MRIIFMGTPDFAVPCLENLIDAGHNVAAVFTQPDKPVGRKQILTPSPVKACAVSHNIKVYQPEKIKNSNALEIINSINPDVIIVVAYGKILPKEILNAAKFGCINVHASLLPKYRGDAPIQWSILNGDEETGVCVMQMDEGIDTGDILLVRKTPIDINETSAELFDRLSQIGADALIDALKLVEKGEVCPTPQPKGDFGYAKMIDRSLCPIDWSKSALDVHNKVRGLQTWPVAITTLNGMNLKIHKTVLSNADASTPGTVVENNKKLVVSCGDGKCVEILELQLDGKKRMNTKSFLLGNKIDLGTVLGE